MDQIFGHIFLHFPLLSIHTRRSNNVHGNPPLFYLGKLFVGFQLQDTSGCLSPSVTGQAFSGIEGSATHPGSSLRQFPSFVGEGRTTKTRNSRFYEDYATPPRLIPLFLHSFWGIPLFCLILGYPSFLSPLVGASGGFPCSRSNRHVERRAFGADRVGTLFSTRRLSITPIAICTPFRIRFRISSVTSLKKEPSYFTSNFSFRA